MHTRKGAKPMCGLPTQPYTLRSVDVASDVALYEEARRAAVELWLLKAQLWKVSRERFRKSSKEYKALDKLCWYDPTSEIRCLADSAACRYADRHGDELFVRTVDGVQLPSVASWFYGSLPQPLYYPDPNRTKKLFGVKELELLEALNAKAQTFMRAAASLPLIDQKRLRAESKKWETRFEAARTLVIQCSPSCQGYLWLTGEQMMPTGVANEIAAFWGED